MFIAPSNLSKVIERIKKALVLADRDRSNTTEEEAATAAAIAARLMEEHQIEEAAMLSASGSDDEPVEDMPLNGEGAGYFFQWRGVIVAALAGTNNCRVYRNRDCGGVLHVIGRKSDAQAIQFLQTLICGQINQVAETEWCNALTVEHGRKWKTSFKVGCALRVAQRIRDEHRKRQKALREDPAMAGALTVIDKRLARVGQIAKSIGLRDGDRVRVTSEDAYYAGRAAGDRIKINAAKSLPMPKLQLGD